MRRRRGRKKMGRRGRRKCGRGKGGQGRGRVGWRRDGMGEEEGEEEGKEGEKKRKEEGCPGFFSFHSPNSHQSHPRVGVKVKVLVAQLCPTLCNSMDCSPPGSSIHGILPVRILEWVVIPFSSGSYRPGWEDSIKSQLSRAMWLLGTTIKTRKRRSRPLMKGDRPLQPRHVNYDHKWWTALSSGGKHLRMNCSGPVFSEHLGFMKYSTYAISSLSVLWS